MNATDTTEGGYLKSEMVTKTLPDIITNYVLKDFSDHIIEYHNVLSNAMDETRINQYGSTSSGAKGASSNWDWASRKIDLMSEVNVYGSTVWSSSGYDIGIDNRQYAIFKLKPELINTDGNGNRFMYWLKAVAYSAGFALVQSSGHAGCVHAATDGGIRPRFLIG